MPILIQYLDMDFENLKIYVPVVVLDSSLKDVQRD